MHVINIHKAAIRSIDQRRGGGGGTKMADGSLLSHIIFLCLPSPLAGLSRAIGGPVSSHYLHVRSVPEGAADDQLTLGAAVTLHHPALHLG